MDIKTYNIRAKIILKSSDKKRSDENIDLTPYIQQVNVSKSIYDPAGEWEITLVPFVENKLSWYYAVAPMDYIEISFSRESTEPLEVVMRGFVDTVGLKTSVDQEGKPFRAYTIKGRDFGTVDRTDQVYLDCWLEEIAGTDDSNIIDSSVGFETSRRLKLSWKVTVTEGGTPVSYETYTDDDNNLHHIALIAELNRVAGDSTITEEIIFDKRNADRALKRGEMFFFQSTAVNVWNVTHNLNSNHLIVHLWDDGYNSIDAPIEILDKDNFRVNFGNSVVRGGAMIKALKMDNIEIGL